MAVIKSKPLGPIDPKVAIAEANRSSVYSLIGKELNYLLNGPGSFYPDGQLKDPQTISSEITTLLEKVRTLQSFTDDPASILDKVVADLAQFKNSFDEAIKNNQPVDNIEVPRDLAPNTEDGNILDPERYEELSSSPLKGIVEISLQKNGNSPQESFNAYDFEGVHLGSEQFDGNGNSQSVTYVDDRNIHPWSTVKLGTDPTGGLTDTQLTLDQNIIAAGGSVGQIFGSALGRALAPNTQFAQLAVGTVAGLIGQKLLQTFTASLTLDASRFIAGNFASVTGLEVANAGLGAISSFLAAELGHELGLTGFGAELFNAGVGGVTGSVLTQVATKVAAGYSFDAAIGLINWSTAATQAGYNISSAAGSFLAHQFVHPESHEGAVGGQLLGAVGSALGLSAVLNATITGFMGFLIPGLGSLFGTIIGTMLGDAIAGDPAYPKAYHDVRILGSDIHFTNRLVGTDNHGNAAVSQEMGDQVVAIANSYLDAVHGAGIAFSGKVMTGYNAGAAPYQYVTGWFPNGTEVVPHFANATDAIQQGVRELLRNTEVIGGDLLMKRAHQAFISGTHPVPTEISPDFTDLIKLSGDLSVAQDYQNYLNNREAINALIAAKHERRRTGRAHPRAGSRARLQGYRMPRPFAATANLEAVRPKRCASIR